MVFDIFILLVCFILFVLIEALAINGVYESFTKGNIFHRIAPGFIDRNREKWWTKPLYSCTKCMSSVWGSLFYWVIVLQVFGFHSIEISGWVINVFMLVVVNFQIYKRS